MNDQSKEQTMYKLRDNLLEMRDGLRELQRALENLHRVLQSRQRAPLPDGIRSGESPGVLLNTTLPLRDDPAALTDMVRRMADSRSPTGVKNRVK